MKLLKLALVAVIALLIVGSPLLAAVARNTDASGNTVETLAPDSSSFSGSGVGAGLGAAVTIIGAGIGFGRIGAAALESMARQPEIAGRIQTAMIVIAALLEGATFFALLICIIVSGKANF